MLKYTWEDFIVDARNIAASVLAGHRKHWAIYAIPRGGLVLGVYLSHTLDLPLLQEASPHFWMKDGRNDAAGVLVVDDNTVVGTTLADYVAWGCTTAVLVHNPVSSCVKPTLYGRETLLWPVFPWEADSGVRLEKAS